MLVLTVSAVLVAASPRTVELGHALWQRRATDALQNPAPIGPHIHPAVILVRIGATQRRWHAPNAAFPPPSHVDIPVPVDVHPPVTRACVRMPLGLVYNALGTACDAALPVAHDDEPLCVTPVRLMGLVVRTRACKD
jgi:hypothetical protein